MAGGLGDLIAAIIQDQATREAKRLRKAATSYLWVGLTAAVGIGYLVGAAYIVAERRFGDWQAAIGFGVGFLVIAGISYLGHRMAARRRARLAAERRRAEARSIAGATALAFLPSLLSRRGGLRGDRWRLSSRWRPTWSIARTPARPMPETAMTRMTEQMTRS